MPNWPNTSNSNSNRTSEKYYSITSTISYIHYVHPQTSSFLDDQLQEFVIPRTTSNIAKMIRIWV